VEVLLKKYFWALNVLVLVGAGYASARAFSSFVAYEVLGVPMVLSAQGGVEQGESEEGAFLGRPGSNRSAELEKAMAPKVEAPVLAEGPLDGEIPSESGEGMEAEGEVEPEAPAPSLSIEFMAAITAVDDSKNMALVKIDGAETRWVAIGDEIKPGFKVIKITNYFISVGNDITELLWKKSEPAPVLADASAGMPPRRGQPQPKDIEKLRPTPPNPQRPVSNEPAAKPEGIRQVSEWEYQIDRARLNEELQDLGKLGRDARVMPNYDRESGTYQGFKLIGVKPNSLYRSIGIRSGDVLMQVNGQELSTTGKALELFNQLQNSSNITIDIMRNGQKHSLVYKIE